MKAHIITVGDELLIGQVIDTNSAWMSQEINLIGIETEEIISIADKHDAIVKAIANALNRSDVVFMTGGLGPTKDDITKKAIADFFGVKMVFNEEAYQHINKFFKKLGKTLSDAHLHQCEMPENALLLTNKMGTAPGMWFEFQNKILVSMPGVPYEMKYLMSNEVLPRLKELFRGTPIAHRTILTVGEGESILAERLLHIESNLPSFIKLAYLPAVGQVRLRLTGIHQDERLLNDALEKSKQDIINCISDIIFGFEDNTLAQTIGELLLQKGLSMGTAESCTGGMIAHEITSIAGASSYYKGSIVAYQNTIKENLLNIDPALILEHGVVSEQVASEMAINATKVLGVDVAVATTGFAGTSPDSDKPIGTMWIAVSDGTETKTSLVNGGRDRLKNIEYATINAMNLLRKFLIAR
ncbi:MAG: CinA family nicotinamide mononucleotide deamidase-related protein [Saprospiraceae bacterium]|nr:CinA family nicotinamide mononucleotide deamidase-related protein [Saprospiraceae bacterium]